MTDFLARSIGKTVGALSRAQLPVASSVVTQDSQRARDFLATPE